MDNYSEEILDKELKKIVEELGFSENGGSAMTNSRPIDLDAVLSVHKLLKRNNLWKLLPKKEKSLVKK